MSVSASSNIRREYQSTIGGLAWVRDLAASVQFLRQQAIIDVCVSWYEDLRFAAETHRRAIPILQFAVEGCRIRSAQIPILATC